MKALIKTIIEPLVDHPDSITVTEKEEKSKVIYHLAVHANDVGKVIGKNGRIAKSIRTIVYAIGSDTKKRIYLDIM